MYVVFVSTPQHAVLLLLIANCNLFDLVYCGWTVAPADNARCTHTSPHSSFAPHSCTTQKKEIVEKARGDPALRVNCAGAGPLSAEWYEALYLFNNK